MRRIELDEETLDHVSGGHIARMMISLHHESKDPRPLGDRVLFHPCCEHKNDVAFKNFNLAAAEKVALCHIEQNQMRFTLGDLLFKITLYMDSLFY